MGGKKSKETEVKSRITEQDRAVLVYKYFSKFQKKNFIRFKT